MRTKGAIKTGLNNRTLGRGRERQRGLGRIRVQHCIKGEDLSLNFSQQRAHHGMNYPTFFYGLKSSFALTFYKRANSKPEMCIKINYSPPFYS